MISDGYNFPVLNHHVYPGDGRFSRREINPRSNKCQNVAVRVRRGTHIIRPGICHAQWFQNVSAVNVVQDCPEAFSMIDPSKSNALLEYFMIDSEIERGVDVDDCSVDK